MSLRVPTPERGIRALGINQDGTCIITVTERGLKIFSTESHATVRDLQIPAIGIASMLYCTSLLAFTGNGDIATSSPRTVTLFNSHANTAIQNLPFPTSVLDLKLNRQHLVVVLESKVCIYTVETLQLWCSISTAPNPKGIAALTLTAQPERLALPGSQSKGIIYVHDISQKEGSVLEIDAHQAPLAALAWSDDGKLLASASTKGTVIRVHSLPQGKKEFMLRRGTTPARITSMAFSPASSKTPLLCVASDHGSVHVFRLADATEKHPARAVVRTVLSAVIQKTPTCRGERLGILELHAKKGTVAACVVRTSAVGKEGEENEQGLTLAVATSEGILYQYSLGDVESREKFSASLDGQWVFA